MAFDKAVAKLKKMCEKHPLERRAVKSLLEELCADQLIDTTGGENSVLQKMKTAGFVAWADAHSYEFGAFAMEVAVRALLDKPVSEEHLARPKPPMIKLQGRGTTATIQKLTSNNAIFLGHKKTVEAALGPIKSL